MSDDRLDPLDPLGPLGPGEDDRLRLLVSDAVDGVEPADRLTAIRARTARSAGAGSRRWPVLAAAAVATAAVLTLVALVLVPRQDDPGPVAPAPPAPETRAVGLYFLGDTPQGPRLFREFQQLAPEPLAALEAITAAGGPGDPDYATPWPAGSFTAITVSDRAIEVTVDPAVAGVEQLVEPDSLAVQQVLHTAQSVTGRADLPLSLGAPPDTTTDLVRRAPQLDVLALVSISDPVEGAEVSDGLLPARGRASSFEATVPWQLLDASGDLVLDGFATADGWQGQLHEWETEIDVSGLPAGTYTFVASTNDPSGGAEGAGPTSDTRTVVVP